jgi:uncharacterized protein (TIGR02001 family)
MLKKRTVALKVTGMALAAAMASTGAQADGFDVSASAAVSNMYLWRGQDLGNGSPAVSGDITASLGGLYAGVWGSSGDDAMGTEYDLYAGYGLDLGGFSIDASVWNYIYPDSPEGNLDTVGELSEVILTMGFGPVSVSYYDNIAGSTGYEYYTASIEMGQFSTTVGYSDPEEDGDYTHVNLSYAYNDNLSFTLSKVVDQDEDEADGVDEDTNFVVSYSLPLN